MSFGKIVAGTVTAVVAAAAIGAGGLFYAEHRAVTQLDNALKSLPSGLKATYATARYSLISGEWNIEGLHLGGGDGDTPEMKIADLTVKDLDRETLRSVFDPQAANTGRALARSVSFSGLIIHGSRTAASERAQFSISHATIPFPYIRTALTEVKVFSPLEWVEIMQAPEAQVLGIRWNEWNTWGRVDRLSVSKLARVERNEGPDGAFVWTAAEGNEGKTAVGEARISDVSFSWRRARKPGDSINRNENFSGSLGIKEITVREGMPLSLTTFRISRDDEPEMIALGGWLKRIEGRSVAIAGLSAVSNEGSYKYEGAAERGRRSPWRETLSIAHLEADRADGTGRFAGLRLKDVRFAHDDFAMPWNRFDTDVPEFVVKKVSLERFEGDDVVFGREAFDLSAKNAGVEKVDFVFGNDDDEELRGSAASFSVRNAAYHDGCPVTADVSMRMLKLTLPSRTDRYGNAEWPRMFETGGITADFDLSYVFDARKGSLEIGKFNAAVMPLGSLALKAGLTLAADDKDSFAEADVAADFLGRFMPRPWASWIAEKVRVRNVDLRYDDHSLLGKYPGLLRLPQEDAAGAWNGFVDDSKAKTLHLAMSPRDPVSVSALIGMFSYYPFDVLKDELGMTLDVSPRKDKAP